MSYYSLSKFDYNENLKTLADTILYEEALEVIQEIQQRTLEQRPLAGPHWKNSAIYSEFMRRNKGDAYLLANDTALKMIKK